jgi:transcriptional regulator with XRE-family HTH domain
MMSVDAHARAQARAELAVELRRLRDRAGQSLRDLQKSTFASDSALSRYFTGQSIPPWRVVEALCVQAKVPPDEVRAKWKWARSRARPRPADEPRSPTLGTVRELQHTLTSSIFAIERHANGAIRTARARGEPVPAALVNIHRASAGALRSLRSILAEVHDGTNVDAEYLPDLLNQLWMAALANSLPGQHRR